MGYRLYIYAPSKNIDECLGKLYGYGQYGYGQFGYELKEDFESAKYLYKIHKIKEFDFFHDGIINKIQLGPIQFKRFYNMYFNDYKKEFGSVYFKDFDLKSFLKDEKKILLEWE